MSKKQELTTEDVKRLQAEGVMPVYEAFQTESWPFSNPKKATVLQWMSRGMKTRSGGIAYPDVLKAKGRTYTSKAEIERLVQRLQK